MLLQHLLDRAVGEYPNLTAVSFRSSKISYGQLGRLSDSFYHGLQLRFGSLDNTPVAILSEKSIDAIVAIWGTLKAGAAYIPLNGADPLNRLKSIIEVSKPRVILFSESFRSKAEALIDQFPESSFLLINEPFSTEKDKNLAPKNLTSKALAYILFTSGSTGIPKGVQIEHGAALAFILWAKDYFSLKPGEKILGNSPFFFDLSVFDIFATAAAGGEMVLASEGDAKIPDFLANLMEEAKVETIYLVPSALVNLMRIPGMEAGRFSFVKKVLFAGEEFPISFLPLLRSIFSGASFWNLYGPTETNVCLFYPLDPNKKYLSGIPLGRACPYAQIFLESDSNGKYFLGVESESLMRGYVGESSWIGPYATGDLLRCEEDGHMYFYGRKDSQIKKNGYRIELPEIERTLCLATGVKRALVLFSGGFLQAFVETDSVDQQKSGELLLFCRSHLPSYMVPEKIYPMKAFPLLPNAKVDRMALAKEFNL